MKDLAVQANNHRQTIKKLRRKNRLLEKAAMRGAPQLNRRPQPVAQIKQKSTSMNKDLLEINGLRIVTKNQKTEIERLNLALSTRTVQNEKKLTLLQREVITNQYNEMNNCENTLF